jgi:hypothetical protein
MREQRIEELLRERPPDESPYLAEIDLHRRRRTKATPRFMPMAIVAVAAIGIGAGLFNARLVAEAPRDTSRAVPSGSPMDGVIPWIDAERSSKPTPDPTQPPSSHPICAADRLVMLAEGWQRATGSLTADAIVINIGRFTCHLSGKPSVQLTTSTGAPLTGASDATRSAGQAVALAPGDSANASFAWSNWCANAPAGPLTLRLFVGDGPLSAEIRTVSGTRQTPRCDLPRTGPTFSATFPFRAQPPPSAASEPCSADQLAAFTGEWLPNLGTLYTTLVVANIPDRMDRSDCSITDTPRLELRDANGDVLTHTSANPSPGQQFIGMHSTVAAVIGLANWCGQPPPLPLTLDLVLDDGRVVVQPVGDAIPPPPCSGGAGDAYLGYNEPLSWRGAVQDRDTGDSHNNDPLTVTISTPRAIRREPLDYTVTLAYALDDQKQVNLAVDCPNYTERLILTDGRTTVETHALNCEPAGVIRRRDSVTFAMRLRIPDDAAIGTGVLEWTLGDRGPSAKTTIEIGG